MRTENVVRSAGAATAAAVLAAGLLLAGAGEARAQGIGVDAGVGASIPMAAMQDAWQIGPSFGLGLVGRVSDRLALRADGELGLNAGARFANDEQGPDLTDFRYTAGVEMRFTNPEVEDWYTVVGVGAGGASMTTDEFRRPNGALDEIAETYFTAYGALRVGYRVNPHVAFSLRSRLYLTVMDPEDSEGLVALSDGEAGGFEEEWTLPTQLRAEFSF